MNIDRIVHFNHPIRPHATTTASMPARFDVELAIVLLSSYSRLAQQTQVTCAGSSCFTYYGDLQFTCSCGAAMSAAVLAR